jgi:transcriptional regulator with XRE-family HTH domain
MSTKSPNSVDVHVGRRIKMRRMMLDVSQSDLGEKSGITFQQIQKYEKGTNRVSASRIHEFANMLDVPVSLFFEGLASNGAKLKSGQYDLAQQLLATRDGIELTKAFMSIDDQSLRRSIVTMVEEIANREAARVPAQGPRREVVQRTRSQRNFCRFTVSK